jgi:hypothetical protein
MMQFFSLRTIYFSTALAGALLSGTYYFVKLGHECEGKPLVACIRQVAVSPTAEPKNTSSKDAAPPVKPVTPEAGPQQAPALEGMLIWTGHLDGEVGHIARADFEKAVRNFQASLGSGGVGGSLSAAQQKALEDRSRNARAYWQFRKVPGPQAGDLWLPAKLLATSKSLRYGRRYESNDDEFSVDVVELTTPDWSLERLKDLHSRGISSARKLEGTIVDRADAGTTGFVLSALDGNERISVRAFQKDNIIRLLAITYDVDRDKEFRILRNVIASNYLPFGAGVKEGRSASCAGEASDRESCNEKPPRYQWYRIVGDH